MKAFVVWLGVTLAAFAALGGGYHTYLEQSPRRVLVMVDSSFPMRASWPAVANTLATLDDARYSRFSLFTDKGRVHSWGERLLLGDLAPYAPRDASRFNGTGPQPEFEAADERILVTNAAASELPDPGGWTVLRLAR